MAEVRIPAPPTPEEIGRRIGELIATVIRISPPPVAAKVVKLVMDELTRVIAEHTELLAREIARGPPGVR